MKKYIGIKNVLDFIFALLLTILLSPILALITLLIKLDSKGPVLFKQRRIGKDNVEFEIYKFRSMGIEAPRDLPTHVFSNAESYITVVGMFLRKSSLDELAQVIGRDELPISEKACLDGVYVGKISFFLDIKILFLTILHVVTRKGISEGGPK